MSQPQLHTVSESEISGATDTWISPTDLPEGVGFFPNRPLCDRFWRFDPSRLMPIPMPSVEIAQTVKDLKMLPTPSYNQTNVILKESSKMLEDWRGFKFYFPREYFWRIGAPAGFIYTIQFQDGDWLRSEARLDDKPIKDISRYFIMLP